MSKLYIVAVMVALLALMVVPAMAEAVTEDTDSADVTLTIEKYCEIGYGAESVASFDITVLAGESAGSDTAPWSASANFSAQVSAVLSVDPVGSADWAYDLDTGTEGTQLTVAVGPGSTGAMEAEVSITGVQIGDSWQDSTNMGTMVISIAAAP